MAIDTEDKRRSTMALACGFRTINPVADGTIGDADRAHAAGFYSGITYSTEVPFTFTGGPLHSAPRNPIDDPIRNPSNDIDQPRKA